MMRFTLRKGLMAFFFFIVVLFTRQFLLRRNELLVPKSNVLESVNLPHEDILQNPLSAVKKDWHNYEQMRLEKLRTGPGEQGAAVIPHGEETERSAYKENGFNIMISDRISLDRSLSDIRTPECKSRKYLAVLPTCSIIIPFHNEGFSTLLRSIHSVINRTPSELLHEIILVDDFSSMPHLREKLERALQEFSLVKLIRLPQREGLIRARLAGIDQATGDVIVILDSHIEVAANWLPPLIEPIAQDRKTVTCPMIDVVHNEDFHYETQAGDAMRGAFDWELYYKRIPIPADKKSDDPSEPFEDPVMAGGLFAADRKYFNEIGQYDSGLEIWGGEQYELSFKVWMCGGRILDTPCSRVGHIYRKFVPYNMPSNKGGVSRNYKRVAEVWMDEYKEYIYKKRPSMRHIDMGDISKQVALRERLQCKSFKWFMTVVAPDIVKYYPAEIPQPAAWGQIKNSATGDCLKTFNSKVIISRCQHVNSMDQSFLLTYWEEVRPGLDVYRAKKTCFDGLQRGAAVTLYQCHLMHGNQLWKYKPADQQLYHPQSDSCAIDRSAGGAGGNNELFLASCDRTDPRQKWSWLHMNQTKLAAFNRHPMRAAP